MWVASRSCPDNSSITSGVSPTHQFGGSTFVTAGPTSLSVCCGWANRAEPPQADATAHRTHNEARRNLSTVRHRTSRRGFFTGESIWKNQGDATLGLSDHLDKPSTPAAKGYEQ